MKPWIVALALGLSACSVDLQRRPDPLLPIDLGTHPCVVTITTGHTTVTLDLGEVGAVAVREAAGRAVDAIQGAGVAVPPVLVQLAAGLAQAGVDEGLCRAFAYVADRIDGVRVDR